MQNESDSIRESVYHCDAFENYIEFSCFTDQFLTGLDILGEPGDLITFDESIDCSFYENIRKMESAKHAMNAEYIRHISMAKTIFADNIEIQKELGLFGIINFDLDSWIEHVKIFYIALLSNGEIFDSIYKNGISLEEIEKAIEMMIQLEEFIFENKKEKENEAWN